VSSLTLFNQNYINPMSTFQSFPRSGATFGSVAQTNSFIRGVFSWMFLALTITSVTAFLFASVPSLLALLIKPEGGLSIIGYVVMFAILMSATFHRLSFSTLAILFVVYATLMGMSLCFIFLMFSMSSIFLCLAITAGMFGTMAIAGYFTKTDLTGFGSILRMALIGIVIASLVNLFLNSETMDWIISYVGVAVFTGLTAYDVQKLKAIGAGLQDNNSRAKYSLMGALTLYLDFVNLFLMLLRIFGDRK
jgi:FtsH-binding integral membrane protein